MSTTRKALIRFRVVHWRRKENVNDAKGALPSSCDALEEIGECRRCEQALFRLRVIHWRREENVDDAKGAHSSSCGPLKEKGECRRREQALFRPRVMHWRREENVDDARPERMCNLPGVWRRCPHGGRISVVCVYVSFGPLVQRQTRTDVRGQRMSSRPEWKGRRSSSCVGGDHHGYTTERMRSSSCGRMRRV